jgi:hypothetical protein
MDVKPAISVDESESGVSYASTVVLTSDQTIRGELDWEDLSVPPAVSQSRKSNPTPPESLNINHDSQADIEGGTMMEGKASWNADKLSTPAELCGVVIPLDAVTMEAIAMASKPMNH